MDVNTVIGLLAVASTILPFVRRLMLELARRRVIRRLERRRGSRVITLIHRQETLSLLGLPIYRYIDMEDSERVLRLLRETPAERPVDLILHTPGGLVLAAEQIAMVLDRHPGPVTVFVPHYAMSGGTLIALAAGRISMDPGAVMGPVDPQLGDQPAASLLKVRAQKPAAAIADETLVLIDLAEKAVAQVRSFVAGLLRPRLGPGRAEEVAEILTDGRWTHDYPLTAAQLRELGLPVDHDVPAEVYELMNLYGTAGQRPSMVYVPAGRRPAGR